MTQPRRARTPRPGRDSRLRPPVRCLLALGSNMGDRRRTLAKAVRGIGRTRRVRVLRRSRLYETGAVPPGAGGPFLNMALACETDLSPMGLLVELKRIEAAAGRLPGPRWGPRPLDIDIVDYGGARFRSPWLALPHPLARRRLFVLAPLAEVAPAWGRFKRLQRGAEKVRMLP